MKKVHLQLRMLLTLLIAFVATVSTSSCSDDPDSNGTNTQVDLNYTNRVSVIPSSITPISASLRFQNVRVLGDSHGQYIYDNIGVYVTYFISDEEQLVDKFIDCIKDHGEAPAYIESYCPGYENLGTKRWVLERYNFEKYYLCDEVFLTEDDFSLPKGLYQMEVCNLKPNTTYHLCVCYTWKFENKTRAEVSDKTSFKTEGFNLAVDMGGSVKWCGVNFLENRVSYDHSQFLSQTKGSYWSKPDPSEEIIPGSWRYPTKNELQELCNECSITLIDYGNQFVRLTNSNGTNLYVPFTKNTHNLHAKDNDCRLMLFPCDLPNTGLGIAGNFKTSESYPFEPSEIYQFDKDQLSDLKLVIVGDENSVYEDFYERRWEVNFSDPITRGIRFVCDK